MYNYILHDFFFMKTFTGNKAGRRTLFSSVHLLDLLICKHLRHPQWQSSPSWRERHTTQPWEAKFVQRRLRCNSVTGGIPSSSYSDIYLQSIWGLSVYLGIKQDDGKQHCEVRSSCRTQAHLWGHTGKQDRRNIHREPVNNSNSHPLYIIKI